MKRKLFVASLLALLAENQLDVEYMYSLFTHKEGKAYMVFRISDEERFNAVLAANSVSTADKDELGLK